MSSYHSFLTTRVAILLMEGEAYTPFHFPASNPELKPIVEANPGIFEDGNGGWLNYMQVEQTLRDALEGYKGAFDAYQAEKAQAAADAQEQPATTNGAIIDPSGEAGLVAAPLTNFAPVGTATPDDDELQVEDVYSAGNNIRQDYREEAAALAEAPKVEEQPVAEQPAAAPAPETLWALCIPAWQRFVPMDEWEPILRDRKGPIHFCEQDPNYLQILPYVTFVDEDNNELFSYTRGKKGAEAGLHDMVSMGVGGHVDLAPAEGESLLDLLIRECIREIGEEVGYKATYDQIKAAFAESFPIYMPNTKVDAVHLGISLTVRVKRDEFGEIEDTLINPQWLPREYANLHMHLASMVKKESLAWAFETWTRVYLSATLGDDNLNTYRQSVKNMLWRFRKQRELIARWVVLHPQLNETVKNRIRMRVVVSGRTETQVTFDNGETWTQFELPLEGVVDIIKASWSSTGDAAEGQTVQPLGYYLWSTLQDKGVYTEDFTSFNEVTNPDTIAWITQPETPAETAEFAETGEGAQPGETTA